MVLKKQPGDFQVEELLRPSVWEELRHQPGAFALYRLEKTSLTTTQALGRAARALKLRPGAFSYAGLKDRHAQTVQYVTLRVEGAETPKEISDTGWSLERLGWLERPLRAVDIAGNGFRLMLRDLTPERCRRIDERAALLSAGTGRLLFVNYFGDQRFGSARVEFLARHLVRGQYREALRILLTVPERKEARTLKEFKRRVAQHWGDWQRLAAELSSRPERAPIEHLAKQPQDFRGAFARLPYFFQFMQVEAYQSWLWNRIAAELLAARCLSLLRAADRFGEMLFAPVDQLEQFHGLNLPVLGPRSRLEEPWREAAQKVLAAEGLSLPQLRLPGLRRPAFREKPRPLLAEANEFTRQEPLAQTGKRLQLELSFVLPRGAYATVLLRALGE